MEHILLVIHVVVTAALIGMVLIQRSETDGFGLGGGSGGNLMTGRATASLMTRATAILATLFIVLSLTLSVMAARGSERSIVDSMGEEENAVPLAVEQDEKTDAVAPALNRDAAMDTDKAAKKTSAKKAESKAVATDKEAPAVPTAE